MLTVATCRLLVRWQRLLHVLRLGLCDQALLVLVLPRRLVGSLLRLQARLVVEAVCDARKERRPP